MTDQLARISSGEPEQNEFMSVEKARKWFPDLEYYLRNNISDALKSDLAALKMEKSLRLAITSVVEEINASDLSPERQEIISEYLFRRLGDLSSAIDNLRLIAKDIRNTDIEGILARHEGR